MKLRNVLANTPKLLWIILIIGVLYSSATMACNSYKYNIYYLPLEAEFYMPPTREYIIKYGTKIEMESCTITNIFKKIKTGGIEPQNEDYKGLRILIINPKEESELFITLDKKILSRGKVYVLDVNIIDKVLKEIADFIK